MTNLVWIPFYTGLATAIGAYRQKRTQLFAMISSLAEKTPLMSYLHFDESSFWARRNNEIDPFTIMAIFNRAVTAAHRTELAEKLASLFQVTQKPPVIFHGIAHLDPRNSIYNGPEAIWNLFLQGLTGNSGDAFCKAWDDAIHAGHNGLAMLSIALFWINPAQYMPVDGISVPFLKNRFHLDCPGTHATGLEYATFLKELKNRAGNEADYPRLAFEAWQSVHGDKIRK